MLTKNFAQSFWGGKRMTTTDALQIQERYCNDKNNAIDFQKESFMCTSEDQGKGSRLTFFILESAFESY